jgi:2-keto-4-pentenoate hydratase/2-oxohepta-3-ene-1,7-dioic acid hydratase in catechol pathway
MLAVCSNSGNTSIGNAQSHIQAIANTAGFHIAVGLDPWKGLKVQTRVNTEIKQDGTTADFIFPVDVIIRYIAEAMTLLPGDVIATGTPAGVGPLVAGDVVEVTVEGVGTLRNPVADE